MLPFSSSEFKSNGHLGVSLGKNVEPTPGWLIRKEFNPKVVKFSDLSLYDINLFKTFRYGVTLALTSSLYVTYFNVEMWGKRVLTIIKIRMGLIVVVTFYKHRNLKTFLY